LCHNCRSIANRIESYFCRSAVGAATAERQNGTLETIGTRGKVRQRRMSINELLLLNHVTLNYVTHAK